MKTFALKISILETARDVINKQIKSVAPNIKNMKVGQKNSATPSSLFGHTDDFVLILSVFTQSQETLRTTDVADVLVPERTKILLLRELLFAKHGCHDIRWKSSIEDLYFISRNLQSIANTEIWLVTVLTIYRKYCNLIGYRTHYHQVIDSVCGMKTSNSIWRPFPAFQKTFRKRN